VSGAIVRTFKVGIVTAPRGYPTQLSLRTTPKMTSDEFQKTIFEDSLSILFIFPVWQGLTSDEFQPKGPKNDLYFSLPPHLQGATPNKRQGSADIQK